MPDLIERKVSEDYIKANISSMMGEALKRRNKTQITKLLKEMAYESWNSKIPRMPAEPTNKDKRGIVPDILGFLLRSFSYLYRTPPVRTSEDPVSASVFQKKLWTYDGGLDPSLVLADQWLRLSGSILLQVSWVETPDGSPSLWDGEDGFKITPYSSDQFAVKPGVNPQYPEAIIIKKGNGWQYWDALSTCDSDGQGKNVDNIIQHNIGILPFVLVQNVAGWPDPIAPRMGTDDIYTTIKNIGFMIREMGWAAVLQRGQPWVSGEPKEQILIAPDATVKVEAGGSFGIAPNAANLDGMMSVLENYLTVVAVTLGLPSRTFKIERSTAMSGVAIQLDQMELESDRQQREVIFRGVEERIARIVAYMEIASGRHNVDTIKPQMSIRFRQPEPIMSFAERKGRAEFVWKNQLCSPEFVLAELYPSASADEIAGILAAGSEYWSDSSDTPINEDDIDDTDVSDSLSLGVAEAEAPPPVAEEIA